MPEALTWCLSLVLIFLGLLGMVVPVLPGLPLVYLGTALHKFAFFTAHPISWTAFWVLTALFIVAQLIELFAGFFGAASAGMNRWGLLGGVIGLIAGLFFSLPGLIFGPLIGLFLGQLFGGQPQAQALRATFAFAVGSVVGFAVKFSAAMAMVAVLLFAVLF
ncbi:MAG: hypothetical protein B9S32_09365 [Verrucomicrobia bacterium Tous-C9LFEB]|nr:MAG: hypothetical protein B9S32_09365 [Verrucomicrobia bacterium Tous-C9LFEB]